MRFVLPAALHRTPSAPSRPDDGTEGPPAAPKPPRGRPVAAYAGILDGRSLWLAVDAAPGSLALRDTASGDVVALRSDLPEDRPAYRSVRVDLTELPRHDPGTYDVVLVPPGGRSPRPVWTAPLPADSPVVVPALAPAPGDAGGTRFTLRRAEDGTLQVHRAAVAPTATLRTIENVPGGVRITLGDVPADGATGELLLLGEDGVLAAFPLAAGAAVVTAAGLPEGPDTFARVGVGTPDAWLPLARERNDLAGVNRAVMLPVLHGEDPDRPRLRFRWSPDALLACRLLGPEQPTTDEPADQPDQPGTQPKTQGAPS